MARTVAIIQARMTSRRLPGKVLLPIQGKPVIQHVVENVRWARLVDDVCVAVPWGEAQLPLVEACAKLGVTVVCGSEDDVLRRYVDAMWYTKADIIVRVTADCPHVSPSLIDAAVVLRGLHNLPFLDARAFRGTEVEVFTREALLDADLWATDPYDREHVGPYMRRKHAVNMCLDTPEDYARLTR